MWWTCKKPRKYWTEIHEMQNILKIKVGIELKYTLINILPNNTPRIHSELLKYMVMLPTVIFAAKWKAERSPDLNEWKKKLNEYAIIA